MIRNYFRKSKVISSTYWHARTLLLNPLRDLRKKADKLKYESRLQALGLENQKRKTKLPENNKQSGKVFIVINIDTEGPCSISKNTNWEKIEREVTNSLSPEFRNKFLDSNGKPFVLNWFIVDWVGANTSTRGRDIGYHKIFDRYQTFIKQACEHGYKDDVYWHYHHIYPNQLESSNNNWLVFPQYEEILTRLILNRNFFPSCYRAGNTWEDNVVSAWLEQWIPFDFSSRAPYKSSNYDWSKTLSDWNIYHPNENNHQKSGEQTRWMARSLSIENGWFRRAEVESAFLNAAEGHDSYISFFTHDYKAMCDYIAEGLSLIQEVATEYPQVEINHTNALEVFHGLTKNKLSETFRLMVEKDEVKYLVSSNLPLQGRQPWLAARDEKGNYKSLDAISESKLKWVIPFSLLEKENVNSLAIAAATTDGQTDVQHIL